jgi:acetylornithine deacetylase/succinyl-diaminopimelate desuccinylase-like protein
MLVLEDKDGEITRSEIDLFVSDLQSLIRQPSVSARKQGLSECANLIAMIMQRAGIKSELLYLDKDGSKSENLEGAAPPIVYGEVKSKSKPNGKTILFYNHYDVQPEDPIELWDSDPFSGRIEGNYIFGRGAADDKGELLTRIKAVEYLLKRTGDVPCNVKFVVEGEEEIGSTHIGDYLVKYRQKFQCNAVIWEFGYIDAKGKPIISLGMKGLLYVELTAKGPARDAHSSLAVLIENPVWRLINALQCIRDKSGKILIKDWYKEVRGFTSEEDLVISNELFDEEEFKTEYGIAKFVNNLTGLEARKALVGGATANIAGMAAGYVGEGAKTIIPSIAKFKLDFRLVPEMVPTKQFERLQEHLRKNGFDDDELQVKMIHGEAAARTSIDDPFVKQVIQAAKEVFGAAITCVSSSGTGPMYPFIKIFNVPCVSVGSTYVFSRIHSPNEYARIDLLLKTTYCIAKILGSFSE